MKKKLATTETILTVPIKVRKEEPSATICMGDEGPGGTHGEVSYNSTIDFRGRGIKVHYKRPGDIDGNYSIDITPLIKAIIDADFPQTIPQVVVGHGIQPLKWHKVRTEKGRFIVSSKTLEMPFVKGVSYSSQTVKDEHDGQHTIERIAVNGIVKHELHCYNGYQRNQAFKKASAAYLAL